MECPAVVVVEGAVGAVAVPAVAEVPLIDVFQRAFDGGRGAVGLDTGVLEESGDGEAEEPPVVVDGRGAEGGQQPVDGPLAHAVVEPVPEPGAGEAQPEGDGGGLDDGLAHLGHAGPRVGGAAAQLPGGQRVFGAGCQAFGVAVEVAVRVVAVRARDPQRGQQPGAGVPFEAVGARPGPARAVAGQVDQAVARRGVGAYGEQELVGRVLPVAAVQPVYGLSSRFADGVGMMLPHRVDTGRADDTDGQVSADTRRLATGHWRLAAGGWRPVASGGIRSPEFRALVDRASMELDRLIETLVVRSRCIRVVAPGDRSPHCEPHCEGDCRRARECC